MGSLSAFRTGPAILSTFSVTSAKFCGAVRRWLLRGQNNYISAVEHQLSLTAHDDHVGRKLRILRSLCERLNNDFCSFRKSDRIGGARGKKGKRGNRLTRSHRSFLIEFASPFATRAHTKSGARHGCVELKVERDVVIGSIEEVDEAPAELESELKKIVARS